MEGLDALLDTLEKDKLAIQKQIRELDKIAHDALELKIRKTHELALTISAIRSVQRLLQDNQRKAA